MLAAHDPYRAQDWVTALRWMQWLLRQRPDAPRLLSQVASELQLDNMDGCTSWDLFAERGSDTLAHHGFDQAPGYAALAALL